MVWRSTATRTRERKRSDPQRVLLGCRCLASAGQLQGRLKERYVKRGGAEEVASCWWGTERGGQRKISIWSDT